MRNAAGNNPSVRVLYTTEAATLSYYGDAVSRPSHALEDNGRSQMYWFTFNA